MAAQGPTGRSTIRGLALKDPAAMIEEEVIVEH
jgi:hypothetical protein